MEIIIKGELELKLKYIFKLLELFRNYLLNKESKRSWSYIQGSGRGMARKVRIHSKNILSHKSYRSEVRNCLSYRWDNRINWCRWYTMWDKVSTHSMNFETTRRYKNNYSTGSYMPGYTTQRRLFHSHSRHRNRSSAIYKNKDFNK